MSVQLGAMTLPFRGYSYERGLEGVAEAGFRYVCVGLPHEGRGVPHQDDEPSAFARAVEQARSRGLEPVMFFCLAHAHQAGGEEAWLKAVERTSQAGIPFILSMGTSSYLPGFTGKRPHCDQAADEARWAEVMRRAAERAETAGVTILVKPHTGNTATAVECRQTLQLVDSPALAVCYDAGNVRFYEGVDPTADLPLIADRVRGLCLKDHAGPRFHMDFPPPGDGCVDHAALFRILAAAGFSGPMMIERVDGRDDAAGMEYGEIVRRLARSRERMQAALLSAGLKPA
ncbi:MAG: sugar phosphate isomerase/epimerase [Phycisphaerae bacterium]